MVAAADSPLSTLLRFVRETVELGADESRSIPEGWIAQTPTLPDVWWLNGVWVQTRMGYEELAGLCERYRGGATYHQLCLDDQAGGEELLPAFRAAGWEIDAEVHSVLSGESDRPVDTGGVIEPLQEESLALMERWIQEDKTLHLTADGVRQLVEANRRTWPLRNTRRFGVRGDGGELQGMTLLYSDGATAQVEDVYVVPEARGRGYGRAMVSAAAALARQQNHELTFIVADDNDWPKQLYAQVGFQPVGRSWLLHRELKGRKPA